MEENSRRVVELAKKLNETMAQTREETTRHAVAMVQATGSPNDPLGNLAKEQAIEKAAIEAEYERKLALAVGDQDKFNILAAKALEMQKLSDHYAEEAARLRHRNLQDFLNDMDGMSKNAGDILYEGLHSALDKFSEDLAKLFTDDHSGKKAHWGKMFAGTLKSIGEGATSTAVHSGLQHGIAAIAKHFPGLAKIAGITPKKAPGTQDGQTEPTAWWVQIAGLRNTPSAPGAIPIGGGNGTNGNGGGYIPFNFPAIIPMGGGAIGGGGAGGGSGIGGAISGQAPIASSFLQSFAASFGGGRAGGGEVDPDSGYVVGEKEPEWFSPGTRGTITPLSKMGGGGDTYVSYSVDARGADLGADNRVKRGLEMTHKSAVATSVQASAEYQKRTPQAQ
jgi:hypothetical protein